VKESETLKLIHAGRMKYDLNKIKQMEWEYREVTPEDKAKFKTLKGDGFPGAEYMNQHYSFFLEKQAVDMAMLLVVRKNKKVAFEQFEKLAYYAGIACFFGWGTDENGKRLDGRR
jgi:hypothetical protein